MGIDPGVKGGVVVLDENSELFLAQKCPNSIEEVNDIIKALEGYQVSAVIEKVWSRPEDTPKTAFTLGHSFGMWLGILTGNGIRHILVSPQKWMSWIGSVPVKGKFENPARFKTKRKNYLKGEAQRRLPGQKITLLTADAALLAFYSKNEAWPNG